MIIIKLVALIISSVIYFHVCFSGNERSFASFQEGEMMEGSLLYDDAGPRYKIKEGTKIKEKEGKTRWSHRLGKKWNKVSRIYK